MEEGTVQKAESKGLSEARLGQEVVPAEQAGHPGIAGIAGWWVHQWVASE